MAIHNNYTSAKISEEVAKAKKQKTEELATKLKQKHEELTFEVEMKKQMEDLVSNLPAAIQPRMEKQVLATLFGL